jgi:hypothetical protein
MPHVGGTSLVNANPYKEVFSFVIVFNKNRKCGKLTKTFFSFFLVIAGNLRHYQGYLIIRSEILQPYKEKGSKREREREREAGREKRERERGREGER